MDGHNKYWILNASKTYTVSVTTHQYIVPYLLFIKCNVSSQDEQITLQNPQVFVLRALIHRLPLMITF
jgi:hypothetical protein